ncbi:protein of unknown function [Microbacterium sp. Nx66]|nr:protein of unknown function [Microbacterium sp. Nx66]CAD5141559.1 protein of unknown function [Microbacterium sp. Nx66]
MSLNQKLDPIRRWNQKLTNDL